MKPSLQESICTPKGDFEDPAWVIKRETPKPENKKWGESNWV